MSGKAVVYIINKFRVKSSQGFRCIMIYQDLDTGFCFIRPLLYKVDLEIVMELYKIFASYGPPVELHVNSCTQDVVHQTEAYIKILLPKFNIKVIKKDDNKNDIAMKVVTKLHEWMKETNKEEWEIGCCIVQREINTEVSAKSPQSPQEQFFTKITKAKNTNAAGDQNTMNVAQKQKNCANKHSSDAKVEQSIPSVNSAGQSSGSSLAKPVDAGGVKKEAIDSEEITFRNRMIVFDGGLIMPLLNKDVLHTEVKIERCDD